MMTYDIDKYECYLLLVRLKWAKTGIQEVKKISAGVSIQFPFFPHHLSYSPHYST